MKVLDYKPIGGIGVDAKTCERYRTPQVLTKSGLKLGAQFSESCTKALSMDGGGFWIGGYNPDYGLYGAANCDGKRPVVLCASELDTLKLANAGAQAVCLPTTDSDPITFQVWREQLSQLGKDIWVWNGTAFKKRGDVLERFLLSLASEGVHLKSLTGSENNPLTTSKDDLKFLLTDPELKPWKPADIVTTSDVMRDPKFMEPVKGITSGYKCIDASNLGLRTSEVMLFTAGTGIGKSTIVREIGRHIGIVEKQRVGLFFLEEPDRKTVQCLAAIEHDIPFQNLRQDPKLLTPKQWKDFETKYDPYFEYYRHFGSLDSERLLSKIEYMATFQGCKWILLDHISIAISGMQSRDERKDIDILMTRLATMCVALDIGIIIISHLKQPDGTAHEEGARVSLNHLRGSKSLSQLSWAIWALERNQQDPDGTQCLVRQLKGRDSGGTTGPIGVLNYNRETGRLEEDTSISPTELEYQMQRARRKQKKEDQMESTRFTGGMY